nr:hypothetical protein Iba_chr06aCG14110 [Ipomoea batatas]
MASSTKITCAAARLINREPNLLQHSTKNQIWVSPSQLSNLRSGSQREHLRLTEAEEAANGGGFEAAATVEAGVSDGVESTVGDGPMDGGAMVGLVVGEVVGAWRSRSGG